MEPIELRSRENAVWSLAMPADWRVVSESDMRFPDPLPNLAAAIRQGLAEPIGSPPLSDMVEDESTVALVMDDVGRPTPVGLLADVVLEVLLAAGASSENITGLFAVGTHPVMGRQAMEERAGISVASRIACRSFDCNDRSIFAFLGRTERGTPVHLNRIAVEADLRILLGTIEPHPQAGFGGGLKNLVPGLAGAETIGHNHLLLPSPERYNMIGTLGDENPMRLDLEEAAQMISGPTLIVNVVLNEQLEPVAVVCGDPVEAHRAGAAICRELYGVPVPHQVDVVISNAYPMGQELRQAGKCILNVSGACRPGGVIVGLMACDRGLGRVAVPRVPLPLSLARKLARSVGHRGLAAFVRRLPGLAPEDRFMVSFGLCLLRDFHVLIFSPHLKQAYQDRFPPVLYDNQDQLFEDVARLLDTPCPEVAVFHQGGVSFPILGHRARLDLC